ncbi:MAG: DUF72 domain-containing protein [Candidatus Aenigmatarchaeota archaeon]
MIKVGTCGWAFFRPENFIDEKKKFKSILQAYAYVYPAVEVNSTFYRIPKVSTAEKWREEVNEVNKNFEFTVKATRFITHILHFTKASVKFFDVMKDICKALGAKILLLQSPNSFKATEENIKRMKNFFDNINREDLIIAWEPRGDWHKKPEILKEVCKDFEVVECVDPFRNNSLYFGKKKIGYFRMHGFGVISMYSYNFSKSELGELKNKMKVLLKKLKLQYYFFNNSAMYQNALEFMKMIS